MSYYGYPNPTTYNYQAYAAYAAAAAASGQPGAAPGAPGSTAYPYQAAYNAYHLMHQQAAAAAVAQQQQQQQQQQNNKGGGTTGTATGSTISQGPQRYNPTSAAAMVRSQMPRLPFTTTPGQLTGGTGPTGGNKRAGFGFKKSGGGHPGSQQPMFYCDVCKISCAGPQTYKEHLDGQKHKKKEQAAKADADKKAASAAAAAAAAATATSGDASAANQQTTTGPSNGAAAANSGMNRRFGNQMANRTQNVIKCELCNVACTGKDAYAAHLRGSKHLKTLKLHKKLGKPIPPELLAQGASPASAAPAPPAVTGHIIQAGPVPAATAQPAQYPTSFPQAQIITSLPSNLGKTPQQINSAIKNMTTTAPTPTQTTATAPGVVASSGPVLNIPAPASASAANDADDDDGEGVSNEPIGREYIETRIEGKITAFYCKLCDCKFNDPNAKDMHTKGRRHRLAYKKKVDPSLIVDMKGSVQRMKQLNTRMQRTNIRSGQMNKNPRVGDSAVVENNNGEQIGQTNGSDATAATGNASLKPLMSDGSTNQSSGPQSLKQFMSQPFKPDFNKQQQQFVYMPNQYGQQQSRSESFDDRHIIAKHNSIFPSKEEINAIQEIVSNSEKALKLVSDQIADEDDSKSAGNETAKKLESAESQQQKPAVDKPRTLKGVMRVGLLSKGLLLRGDTDVKLVVVCEKYPTKELLERVYRVLLQKIEVVAPDVKYNIIMDPEAEVIMIVRLPVNDMLQPLITCRIVLTSPTVRAEDDTTTPETMTISLVDQFINDPRKEQSNTNYLDKQKCLDSLAELRHANWFQAKANQVQNCVLIIRILRDLCRRNPTWSHLTQWSLELLVERCLSSATQHISPGEGLRRVLECVSSGVLLSNGPGLFDPCEKKPTDAVENLKKQQREEITASAQMALRLLAFKQIYKILGMECLTQQHSNNNSKTPQKRPLENETEGSDDEAKREKVDDSKDDVSLVSD